AETPQANGSILFRPRGFLYFEISLPNPAIIFIDLKVLLPNGRLRNAPIRFPSRHGYNSHRVFRTDEIVPLFSEFQDYSLDWQVFVGSSNALPIKVYQYYEVSGTEETSSKLDRIFATQVIGDTINPAVGLLSGGVVSQVIPALTEDSWRSGLEISNPSTEPVLIGFDNTLSAVNFDKVIAPGETLSLGAWHTDIYAMAPNGGNVQLNVTDYRAP
ncbi:MAG: hypothetical protein ACPGVO_20845, partial [Spirulinaceae cyanobacterium]